jgi:hypothetical protein
VLLAVEFVEVLRGKLLITGTKAFLLVSVLLRMVGGRYYANIRA